MSSTDSPNNQLNSLTQNPNQSFIQLFFTKPNDILRFPLFLEDNPRRLEAIRARGGLSDFSPEALKQLQDIFHTLKSGDYSRYSPERVTYLDFLKHNTLHALKEYTRRIRPVGKRSVPGE